MRIITCPYCSRRLKRFFLHNSPARVPEHLERGGYRQCRGSGQVCSEDERCRNTWALKSFKRLWDKVPGEQRITFLKWAEKSERIKSSGMKP